MCGIFGFISCSNVKGLCFERGIYALRQLQNRGYDSAGLAAMGGQAAICGQAAMGNKDIKLRKYATTRDKDSIDRLELDVVDFYKSTIGIFHTRWATHGAKTDYNAHPHLDQTNRIALVHNGIIENYLTLKLELQNLGYKFRSETDSEVISNLISMYYDESKNMEQAINSTVSRLEGTWALVIMCADTPNKLYCIRHGSSLLVGFSEDYVAISSELAGFGKFVDRYICLDNHDLIVLEIVDNQIKLNAETYEIRSNNLDSNELSPEPYPHWTIKEIVEQYESSLRAINFGGRVSDSKIKLGGLEQYTESILKTEHLILLGCGTSLNAAKLGIQYFRYLNNFTTVQAIDGSEFMEQDIPLGLANKTSVIFLSQSGETKDLHRCIKICDDMGILLKIGVVNVVDSLIAREVDCGCYLNAGREVGVASTKAFTSQIIVLSMISAYMAQIFGINLDRRLELIESLKNLSSDILKTIKLFDDIGGNIDEDILGNVSRVLIEKPSMFILAKGYMLEVAKEIALKTKEIGYIHSEAYGGNALRHGTYALIESGTPIVFVNPRDSNHSNHSNHSKLCSTIEEVKSRGAMVITVTDSLESIEKSDYVIRVPFNKHFQGILHNIPFQFIAYYMSILKGNNPDKPKNLSKCVSV